jgi:hypothetical protein
MKLLTIVLATVYTFLVYQPRADAAVDRATCEGFFLHILKDNGHVSRRVPDLCRDDASLLRVEKFGYVIQRTRKQIPIQVVWKDYVEQTLRDGLAECASKKDSISSFTACARNVLTAIERKAKEVTSRKAITGPLDKSKVTTLLHPACLRYIIEAPERDLSKLTMPLDGCWNLESFIDRSDYRWLGMSEEESSGQISMTVADFQAVEGTSGRLYAGVAITDYSTGGSGVFSKLVAFDIVLRDRYYLEASDMWPLGDRCNDGMGKLESMVDANSMLITTAATPHRLLNPELRGERAAALADAIRGLGGKDPSESNYGKYNFFLNLEPYNDLNNSAISCVGTLKNVFTKGVPAPKFTHVELDMKPYEIPWGSGAIPTCLSEKDAWFGFEAKYPKSESGKYLIPADEWQELIQNAGEYCSREPKLS